MINEDMNTGTGLTAQVTNNDVVNHSDNVIQPNKIDAIEAPANLTVAEDTSSHNTLDYERIQEPSDIGVAMGDNSIVPVNRDYIMPLTPSERLTVLGQETLTDGYKYDILVSKAHEMRQDRLNSIAVALDSKSITNDKRDSLKSEMKALLEAPEEDIDLYRFGADNIDDAVKNVSEMDHKLVANTPFIYFMSRDIDDKIDIINNAYKYDKEKASLPFEDKFLSYTKEMASADPQGVGIYYLSKLSKDDKRLAQTVQARGEFTAEESHHMTNLHNTDIESYNAIMSYVNATSKDKLEVSGAKRIANAFINGIKVAADILPKQKADYDINKFEDNHQYTTGSNVVSTVLQDVVSTLPFMVTATALKAIPGAGGVLSTAYTASVGFKSIMELCVHEYNMDPYEAALPATTGALIYGAIEGVQLETIAGKSKLLTTSQIRNISAKLAKNSASATTKNASTTFFTTTSNIVKATKNAILRLPASEYTKNVTKETVEELAQDFVVQASAYITNVASDQGLTRKQTDELKASLLPTMESVYRNFSTMAVIHGIGKIGGKITKQHDKAVKYAAEAVNEAIKRGDINKSNYTLVVNSITNDPKLTSEILDEVRRQNISSDETIGIKGFENQQVQAFLDNVSELHEMTDEQLQSTISNQEANQLKVHEDNIKILKAITGDFEMDEDILDKVDDTVDEVVVDKDITTEDNVVQDVDTKEVRKGIKSFEELKESLKAKKQVSDILDDNDELTIKLKNGNEFTLKVDSDTSFYDANTKTINLSKDSTQHEAYHELFHVVDDLSLTDADREYLNKLYNVSTVEQRANWYADNQTSKEVDTKKANTIISKIRSGLDKVVNLLNTKKRRLNRAIEGGGEGVESDLSGSHEYTTNEAELANYHRIARDWAQAKHNGAEFNDPRLDKLDNYTKNIIEIEAHGISDIMEKANVGATRATVMKMAMNKVSQTNSGLAPLQSVMDMLVRSNKDRIQWLANADKANENTEAFQHLSKALNQDAMNNLVRSENLDGDIPSDMIVESLYDAAKEYTSTNKYKGGASKLVADYLETILYKYTPVPKGSDTHHKRILKHLDKIKGKVADGDKKPTTKERKESATKVVDYINNVVNVAIDGNIDKVKDIIDYELPHLRDNTVDDTITNEAGQIIESNKLALSEILDKISPSTELGTQASMITLVNGGINERLAPLEKAIDNLTRDIESLYNTTDTTVDTDSEIRTLTHELGVMNTTRALLDPAVAASQQKQLLRYISKSFDTSFIKDDRISRNKKATQNINNVITQLLKLDSNIVSDAITGLLLKNGSFENTVNVLLARSTASDADKLKAKQELDKLKIELNTAEQNLYNAQINYRNRFGSIAIGIYGPKYSDILNEEIKGSGKLKFGKNHNKNAQAIDMTKDQIINLYLTIRQDFAKGRSNYEFDSKGVSYEEYYDKVKSFMTDKDFKYAHTIQEDLNNRYYDSVRDTLLSEYGMGIGKRVSNYFPVNMHYVKAGTTNATSGSKIPSFVLKRSANNLDFNFLANASSVYLNHCADAETFINMTPIANKITDGLLRYSNMNTITTNLSPSVASTFREKVSATIGGGLMGSAAGKNRVFDAINKTMIYMTLGANIPVFAGQFASMGASTIAEPAWVRYNSDIADKVSTLSTDTKKILIKRLMESPAMQSRMNKEGASIGAGGLETDLDEFLRINPNSKIDTALHYFMILNNIGDRLSIRVGIDGVLQRAYAKQLVYSPDLNSEQQLQNAIDDTMSVIQASQQSSFNSQKALGQISGNNYLYTLFNTFHNTTRQYAMLELQALDDAYQQLKIDVKVNGMSVGAAMNKAWKDGDRKLAHAAYVVFRNHIVTAGLYTALRIGAEFAAYGQLPDDDDWWIRFGLAGILGPANGILILGDMSQSLLNYMFADGRMTTPTAPAIDFCARTLKNSADVAEGIWKSDVKTIEKGLNHIINQSALGRTISSTKARIDKDSAVIDYKDRNKAFVK